MNINDYKALDFKEKMLFDLLTDLLIEQKKQTSLLEEFIKIVKISEADLDN